MCNSVVLQDFSFLHKIIKNLKMWKTRGKVFVSIGIYIFFLEILQILYKKAYTYLIIIYITKNYKLFTLLLIILYNIVS